jgi:hypothetical protein
MAVNLYSGGKQLVARSVWLQAFEDAGFINGNTIHPADGASVTLHFDYGDVLVDALKDRTIDATTFTDDYIIRTVRHDENVVETIHLWDNLRYIRTTKPNI